MENDDTEEEIHYKGFKKERMKRVLTATGTVAVGQVGTREMQPNPTLSIGVLPIYPVPISDYTY